MATSHGTSTFKKPWAWLAAVAVFGVVLAASAALYAVNPGVELPFPWWASVVAPVLFYALVLPACVPGIRIGAWLTGFLILAVLHVGIGLATAGVYATASVTSFEQALAPALCGFPPALVLNMIGSLGMAYPFLGALAPSAAGARLRETADPFGLDATRMTRQIPPETHQAPAVNPSKDRRAWARGPSGTGSAATVATAVASAASALPAETGRPVPAAAESVAAAPARARTASAAPDTVKPGMSAVESPSVRGDDALPVAIPDFKQALTELFGSPAAVKGPADGPAPPEQAASGAVVGIPFDRVAGQLPPGAFRVPLDQVGARLLKAEMLVVDMAVIVPQLGEGVVQVEWERVADQFPPEVFAVAPAEMKDRIVNGRLLLPLDEIVRQVPREVFAASLGRGPVAVPGIESFPAPFTPLEWAEPSPEPTVAQAASVAVPPPPAPPGTSPEPAAVPATAPEPVAVERIRIDALIMETPVAPEPQVADHKVTGAVGKVAALAAPWDTSALDQIQMGDFAIISVSAAGVTRGAVAAAAGRLSPLLARRAPRPVEQATLRGVAGTLVLTPVGSGWRTGTALAVGVRQGGALARVEMLARHTAAARESTALTAPPREPAPAVRLEAATPPAGAMAAAEDLEAFGMLTAHSYREPTSGALIHCLVSPGTSADELAPFAWELAQSMAHESQAGALGPFHSAVLRSGRERLEIRRLPSATGPAPLLVVTGADSGRPGLARLQVERAAARLCEA